MSVLQGTGFAATVTPSSGSTAGYTPVLTVTAPGGATSTPTVTTTATAFTATVPATLVGNYLLVWTLTGSPTQVIQDQFTSIAPTIGLVNLAKVKSDLNRASTDTTKDAKLRAWIREAQSVIEDVTGPIIPQAKTYTVDGDNTFLVLPDRWVVSITSLVENMSGINWTLTEQPLGAATDNYGYTWERSINKIVRRSANGAALNFADGTGNVTCVYMAGLASVPEVIQRAAVQLIAHWYKKDDQSFQSPFPGGGPAEVSMVGNYEVPNSVMELLKPYRKSPGIF